MKHYIGNFYFLAAIIIIAVVIRFIGLGSIPGSINWDEAALGYNAYSILETGKDEYGAKFPLILRSFDDYKPALYSYFIIPFIPIFDLTEFTVRLPSAIAGVAAVILTYFLILKIFGNQTALMGRTISTRYLALLSAFLLAISPWHVQFSRIAFESNVGLTINLAALLLFLYGLRRPWLLIVAFGLGALNIHMYQSDRVFTPLMLLCATIIYYKDVWAIKKYFIIASIVAVLVVVPFVSSIFLDENALLRAKGVSVFSSQTELLEESVDKLMYDRQSQNILGLILDNRRIEYAKQVVYGYISHFDLNWLFITGDIARHHAPNMGLLYIVHLPFLFIGIYQLAFGRFSGKTKLLIFSYFLIAPIPASITSGVPHAVRTLNFLPMFQVFIALGLLTVGVWVYARGIRGISHKLALGAFLIFYGGALCLNVSYYLNQYFVQQNYFHARDWLYGYEELVHEIDKRDEDYDQIVISSQPPFDQSYIFFLFYLKIDPEKYLSQGGTVTGGFREERNGFDNYRFEEIGNPDDYPVNTLFMGRPEDISDTPLRTLHTVHYPDGAAVGVIADK